MNDFTVGGKSIHGIVHLARNPGDHILRNTFRWPNQKTCPNNSPCFHEQAKKFCEQLPSGDGWSGWHNFWFEKGSRFSSHIFHYERFSSLDKTVQATDEVMKFLNEPSSFSSSDALKIINEPSYVHGTLLAEICGKEKARELHERTKEVSRLLGYVFDNTTATWSLNI